YFTSLLNLSIELLTTQVCPFTSCTEVLFLTYISARNVNPSEIRLSCVIGVPLMANTGGLMYSSSTDTNCSLSTIDKNFDLSTKYGNLSFCFRTSKYDE